MAIYGDTNIIRYPVRTSVCPIHNSVLTKMDLKCRIFIAVVFILWVTSGTDADVSDDQLKVCNQKLRCNDCITERNGKCSWCKDNDYPEIRCSFSVNLTAAGCQDVFSPTNNMTLIQNIPLIDGSEKQDPVQLRPQKVQVKLRPGQQYKLPMKYKIAQNLPIDMYFVLDNSVTMKTRLQELGNLTEKLITELQNTFTKNIYIGFGTFLDKTVEPYHITVPEYLDNPCVLSNTVCNPSYGYIHRTSLNSNTAAFIATIKKDTTSANFDPMEGGLDAVLQASVCPDIVGWRETSRRVLVYISDSGFHFAGDGKLGGIDKPVEAQCNMKTYGTAGEYIYTESNYQDYPSLGMIKKSLDDNNINTFFVVDAGDKNMYKEFSDMIKQAQTAILDSSGAEGIVKSITDFYTEISQKVTLSAVGIPDEIEVLMQSNCASGSVVNTNDLKKVPFECNRLKPGIEVEFDVLLTVSECPAALANGTIPSRTFTIQPAGLQEKLEIEVEFICDCNCTRSQELDEKCTKGNGTYLCGVCECNEGRSGEFCQCDNINKDVTLEDSCKKDINATILCENSGVCECGQCKCFPNYLGKHCENYCDTSKCRKLGDENELCSGKSQGTCVCDKCECLGEFSGKYCNCPSEKKCLAANGLLCNGHGRCDCGKCVCESGSGYEGELCEDCPRCDKCRKCGQTDCVKCLEENPNSVVDQNNTNLECLSQCSAIHNITRVAKFDQGVEPCGLIDTGLCEISYLVTCNKADDIFLQIANTKQCPNPPDPLLIAMPLLAGIIGVGLLLLIIWKILTSFYDKIEYAKFDRELQNPKWSQTDNPIYKTPVTSNQNPMFTGQVDD